jgi:hypothetical protein
MPHRTEHPTVAAATDRSRGDTANASSAGRHKRRQPRDDKTARRGGSAERPVAEFESLSDCLDLKRVAIERSAADFDAGWTLEELRRIIKPLVHRNPVDWPHSSARVTLLNSLVVDSTRYPGHAAADVRRFIEGPLAEYTAHWENPHPGCVARSHIELTLDQLYSFTASMAAKPTSGWTEAEVAAAVSALRGGPSLVGRGCAAQADEAWWTFYPKWEAYLIEHPAVRREVDPYFVVVDVLGNAPPPNLAAAVAAYPPAGSPAEPPGAGLNGSPHFLPFGSSFAARRFIGWLQASVPGLRCWLTNNIAAPVLY